MPAQRHRPFAAPASHSASPRPKAGSTLRRGLLFATVAVAATTGVVGSAFAADVAPPSQPGTLTQTPLDFGKTQLSWGASTDDTGVVAYEIDAPATNGDAAQHLVVDGSTTQVLISGFPIGPRGNQQYRVIARDAAGNASTPTNSVLLPACAFDTYGAPAVTNVSVTAVTDNAATISWTVPALPSWCFHAVTGFEVRVPGAGGATTSADARSLTLNGLSAGTAYTASVIALPPGRGNGSTPPQPPSVDFTTTGGDTQAPTQPGTLTQTPLDFGKTRLSWGASTDDVGVASYEVTAPATMANPAISTVVPGDTTELVLSELPTGATAGAHQLRVVARDAAGNVSPPSNEISTRGCGFDIFGAPAVTNLVATEVAYGGFTISWTPGVLKDWCNHAPTGYSVLLDGQPVGSTTADQTSFKLPTLTTGAYRVGVAALPQPSDVLGPVAIPEISVLTGPMPTQTPPPSPTPTPIEPTPTPGDQLVPYAYSLAGSATLKSLTKGSLPLSGSIAAKLGIPSGKFTGDLTLAPSTGNLTALGFLPVVAKVNLVPTEQVTGTLKSGKLTAVAKVRIKLPSVKTFGIELAGGANCQAKQISSITLNSTQPTFLPLSGGPLAGTFGISDLSGCGFLTGIVSPLTSGSGNTIALNLTPAK